MFDLVLRVHRLNTVVSLAEQIELFPKRAFVCDCPTRVGDTNCTLHKGVIAGNESNAYGQNFEGKFCRCRRAYDAKHERETMVQCVVCEDWYHESCLNLRTRPNERHTTPEHLVNESSNVDDGDSNASNDLPSPLLPSSTYDSLICGTCVVRNDTLRRWAGTPGIMMIARKEGDEESTLVEDGGVDPRWEVLNGKDDVVEAVVGMEKDERKHERKDGPLDACGNEERSAKRPRTESSSVIAPSAVSPVLPAESSTPCLGPPMNSTAQKVLSRLLDPTPASEKSGMGFIGEGDIFLTEGWRERWCRCPTVLLPLLYPSFALTSRDLQCHSALQKHPYLFEEEETYEPPEDPDSGASICFSSGYFPVRLSLRGIS